MKAYLIFNKGVYVGYTKTKKLAINLINQRRNHNYMKVNIDKDSDYRLGRDYEFYIDRDFFDGYMVNDLEVENILLGLPDHTEELMRNLMSMRDTFKLTMRKSKSKKDAIYLAEYLLTIIKNVNGYNEEDGYVLDFEFDNKILLYGNIREKVDTYELEYVFRLVEYLDELTGWVLNR